MWDVVCSSQVQFVVCFGWQRFDLCDWVLGSRSSSREQIDEAQANAFARSPASIQIKAHRMGSLGDVDVLEDEELCSREIFEAANLIAAGVLAPKSPDINFNCHYLDGTSFFVSSPSPISLHIPLMEYSQGHPIVSRLQFNQFISRR